MDISTVLGLVIGFGAIFGSVILEGGSLSSLMNGPAAIIVFGGTIGAAFISFPKEYVLRLPSLLKQTLFNAVSMDELDTIDFMGKMAEKARKEGLLSLEEEAQTIDDGFLKRGTQLVVDGTDPETVRSILEIDLFKMRERHEASFGVLEAMGGYAPTMGIIGTVMGLVNVLGNLSKPEELGHSIASAFIATLYGIFSANLLWLPLGSKLKKRSEMEASVHELMLEGLLSIQAGENPRIVREKLVGFLSPSMRNVTDKHAKDRPADQEEVA